jgi:hypothetical protein
MMLKRLCRWWILKRRHSVRRRLRNKNVWWENDAQEVVLVVDFEEG